MSNRDRRISAAAKFLLSPLLIAGIAACSREPPQTPPAVHVTFITVEPRATTVTAEYPALIEASNTVEIRPRVGGLLLSQSAIEGRHVRKGETLFVIDPAPYRSALAQAQGDLARAMAALTPAQRNLDRSRKLAEQQLISKGDLDTSTGNYEGAKAAQESAAANVETARLNLSYTNVTSPIDGVAGRSQLRVGAVVVGSQTLLTYVYAVDPMYVNFGVSESALPQLSQILSGEQSAHTEFQLLLTDGSEYPLRGKLDFVDPAINAQTGTLPVRLSVSNANGVLHSNQFARVVVPARQVSDATLVPIRAVQELQGKNYLWIIDGSDQVQQRDVKAGPQVNREDWLIEAGIKAGDRVVVDGVQRLQSGERVQATALSPDAARAGGISEAAASAPSSPAGP
jgi:membrane fusion protein (multidrug efflux system)